MNVNCWTKLQIVNEVQLFFLSFIYLPPPHWTAVGVWESDFLCFQVSGSDVASRRTT